MPKVTQPVCKTCDSDTEHQASSLQYYPAPVTTPLNARLQGRVCVLIIIVLETDKDNDTVLYLFKERKNTPALWLQQTLSGGSD